MRADRPQLEIAVTSATAAAQAIGHGADRVELCVALETGGVTPSQALVEATLATGAESHVLVRSRPGDFLYEPDEVALMAQEAATLVRAGVHGVVIGALTEAHTLDLSAMRIMADAARAVRADVSVTIHRCIDASRDPIEAATALAADRHRPQPGSSPRAVAPPPETRQTPSRRWCQPPGPERERRSRSWRAAA